MRGLSRKTLRGQVHGLFLPFSNTLKEAEARLSVAVRTSESIVKKVGVGLIPDLNVQFVAVTDSDQSSLFMRSDGQQIIAISSSASVFPTESASEPFRRPPKPVCRTPEGSFDQQRVQV